MKRNILLKTAIGFFAAGCILLGAYTLPGLYSEYKQQKIRNEVIEKIVPRKVKTFEKYGKNLVYFDFFKIPEQDVAKEKIPLPKDLEDFINDRWNKPKIGNDLKFLDDFYEQALKLGYDDEKFKNMSVKESVKAVVDIVASRMTYCDVDNKKNWFAKKYGMFLDADEYFHYGFGDCDKYRDITMAAFEIIKKDNPNLQNVYLSGEELGGSIFGHAWVSIIIPQKDCLIISHIDPTFYDNKRELEACKDECDAHVLVYNDAFKAYFYKTIKEYELACELFKESFCKTKDSCTIEKILNDTCYTASRMRYKEKALENIEWIRKEYESKGFTENLDDILYYSYTTYKGAGDKNKAEEYKQRLLKEFPKSYWAGLI